MHTHDQGTYMMASSRIYVSGLPPNITEPDFRKHFSKFQVTDVKLIPKRRIAFVGYHSSDEAAKAVKYFNRSYIRLSKIRVELATPPKQIAPHADAVHKVNGEHVGLHTSAAKLDPDHTWQQEANSKKRRREEVDESDPKLQEYLELMQPGRALKKAREADNPSKAPATTDLPAIGSGDGNESDDDYEALPNSLSKEAKQGREVKTAAVPEVRQPETTSTEPKDNGETDGAVENTLEDSIPVEPAEKTDIADDDWLRQRTNRLLDLAAPDDPNSMVRPTLTQVTETDETEKALEEDEMVPANDAAADQGSADAGRLEHPAGDSMAELQKTGRLFLRNLAFDVSQDDILDLVEPMGSVKEILLNKGFAFVQFWDSSAAVSAYQQLDGTTFQGRLLHIIPAKAKQELDDFALAKLPLKKRQLIKKRAEAASKRFQWNSLWMNPDAIAESTADRLGVSKADLLDPTSSDAAVKQAIAETNVIKETKAYFAANGIDIDAFKSLRRDDTTILVKNFPYGTTIAEIRKMFEEHGPVLKVLMPPTGTIAIVQFADVKPARAAYTKLAYTFIKGSMLFLEKGPKNLFRTQQSTADAADTAISEANPSAAELLEREDEPDSALTSTLFIRNLNFTTTTELLSSTFKALEGFVKARVKYRPDPKRPGQLLSMGYGFIDFRTKEHAAAALGTMDGYVLEGHTLSVKPSQKGLDPAEERKREDRAKKLAANKTKLVVRNVPFEAGKKDIRALLSTYGELRAVRLPKKFGNRTRGFAFAEFATPREAENCFNALKDTHLLGRRLVLEWADAEAVDAEEEIEKMQKKVGGQFNKMSLQQLTGDGRKKVNIGGDDNQVD